MFFGGFFCLFFFIIFLFFLYVINHTDHLQYFDLKQSKTNIAYIQGTTLMQIIKIRCSQIKYTCEILICAE